MHSYCLGFDLEASPRMEDPVRASAAKQVNVPAVSEARAESTMS